MGYHWYDPLTTLEAFEAFEPFDGANMVTIIKVKEPSKEVNKGKPLYVPIDVTKGQLEAACREFMWEGFCKGDYPITPNFALGVNRTVLTEILINGMRRYGEMYEFIDFDFKSGTRKVVESAVQELMAKNFAEFTDG